MQRFSLLVRVHRPNDVLLQQPTAPLFQLMVQSVLNQSNNDWELVLVAGDNSPADQMWAEAIAGGHANIRTVIRPEGEPLAWACNALLPTLGEWVGFLGQHDQLTVDALEQMAQAMAASPQAIVIYSDEESFGTWGGVSLQRIKRTIDPIRLLSEDYLRDLVLIKHSWLASAGGFDPQASDAPTHDLYLRLLEARGSTGFANVAAVLYLRYRARLAPRGTDPRLNPYLSRYDLQGVRRHFARLNIPATIQQWNGTLDIAVRTTGALSVTVLCLEDPGYQDYQPATIRIVALEPDMAAALNQAISTVDTDYTLLLLGQPLGSNWLSRLVATLQLPGVTAVGGTVITPTRQVAGGPWDTRGQFNQLAVPHAVSQLTPACMLLDTRQFHQLGGFEPTYPTLYAADYAMRLAQAGGICTATPRVYVEASPTTPAEPGELSLFRAAWQEWEDPYGLHQLP